MNEILLLIIFVIIIFNLLYGCREGYRLPQKAEVGTFFQSLAGEPKRGQEYEKDERVFVRHGPKGANAEWRAGNVKFVWSSYDPVDYDIVYDDMGNEDTHVSASRMRPQNPNSSLMGKSIYGAKLTEKEKKEMAGSASDLWAQVKKDRLRKGEGEPNEIEEEAMKKFLTALKTPGTEIAAPGGNTEDAWKEIIKKGPPPPLGPPLEYNDKKWNKGGPGPGKDGAEGPGNAWVPEGNPENNQIERGHFAKLAWDCAHAVDDLKRKVKLNVKAHKKWKIRCSPANIAVLIAPAVDAACAVPIPCMAGTITAIAQCAATMGIWFDARGWTWICMTASEFNISRHRLLVQRFVEWVEQKKKFGCWNKKTDTKNPYPDIANVFRKVPPTKIDKVKANQKEKPRYITGVDTPKIDILMPQAMTLAFIAKTAVGIAHKATMIAIVSNIISVAAFPVKPATYALIGAAGALWKVADVICDKAKDMTFDLVHEVIKFERSRVVACSLPGTKAIDPRMVLSMMAIKPVPKWLKMGDSLRGKGHKPEIDEIGSQMP
jgi:hypothetical protein